MAISRETLERCFDTMKLSESIWERMQKLRSRTEGTTPSYSTQPHGGGTSDKVGDGVAELDKLLTQFEREVDVYARLAADVNEAIQMLEDPKLRNLMGLRYLDGLPWDEVADRIGYSVQRCYELHNLALLAMGLKVQSQSELEM